MPNTSRDDSILLDKMVQNLKEGVDIKNEPIRLLRILKSQGFINLNLYNDGKTIIRLDKSSKFDEVYEQFYGKR